MAWTPIAWTPMAWTPMAWTPMAWTPMAWTPMAWTPMAWTPKAWTSGDVLKLFYKVTTSICSFEFQIPLLLGFFTGIINLLVISELDS